MNATRRTANLIALFRIKTEFPAQVAALTSD